MVDIDALAGFFIIIVLFVLAVIVISSIVRIVPQGSVYVIERLGRYSSTWQTGLKWKIPILDRISKKVSIKEQVLDFNPQPVITKDNVTVQIDSIVFFQVVDAKLFAYGVERPISAIEYLTATTLRNICGELELDQTLTSRDLINTKITSILDAATDKWGIKVNRVEIRNIIPPREIQDAMERQMKAERDRREAILRAEGEKRSAILVAEGEKESRVLQAEGEKLSHILRAEAEAEALVKEASGKAEAIMLVQKATADTIKLLNEAAPDHKVLMLKSFEAMEKVADGKATKLIIPSEMQALGGLAASLKEIVSASGDKPES